MNLWIIGALMAIGLLSIIGLVTMVMEEQKSKRAPRGEPARWTDTEETMAVAPAPEEARLQRIGGQIRELTDQMDSVSRKTQDLEGQVLDLAERLQQPASGEQDA